MVYFCIFSLLQFSLEINIAYNGAVRRDSYRYWLFVHRKETAESGVNFLLKVGVHPFFFSCFFKAGFRSMFHSPAGQQISYAKRMWTVLPAFTADVTLASWSFVGIWWITRDFSISQWSVAGSLCEIVQITWGLIRSEEELMTANTSKNPN